MSICPRCKYITYYAFSDDALRNGFFYKAVEYWEGPDKFIYYIDWNCEDVLDALPPGIKENYKSYSQREAKEITRLFTS
jgi:hypothetical protein